MTARSGEVLTLSPVDSGAGTPSVATAISDPLPPTASPGSPAEAETAGSSEVPPTEAAPAEETPTEAAPDAAPPPVAPAPSATASSALATADPETPRVVTRQAERSPEARAEPASPSTGEAPPGGGWVRAVARTFVNVRSAPASDSEVQGVLAENAVVFLGDTRGAWRQVRSGNVAGWVWEPLFNVVSEGP